MELQNVEGRILGCAGIFKVVVWCPLRPKARLRSLFWAGTEEDGRKAYRHSLKAEREEYETILENIPTCREALALRGERVRVEFSFQRYALGLGDFFLNTDTPTADR